jgi:hypothetical protein
MQGLGLLGSEERYRPMGMCFGYYSVKLFFMVRATIQVARLEDTGVDLLEWRLSSATAAPTTYLFIHLLIHSINPYMVK